MARDGGKTEWILDYFDDIWRVSINVVMRLRYGSGLMSTAILPLHRAKMMKVTFKNMIERGKTIESMRCEISVNRSTDTTRTKTGLARGEWRLHVQNVLDIRLLHHNLDVAGSPIPGVVVCERFISVHVVPRHEM